MKKTTTAAKTAGAKSASFSCACPYCDEEVTADRTPLFCTPCTVATVKTAKKTTRKTAAAVRPARTKLG